MDNLVARVDVFLRKAGAHNLFSRVAVQTAPLIQPRLPNDRPQYTALDVPTSVIRYDGPPSVGMSHDAMASGDAVNLKPGAL